MSCADGGGWIRGGVEEGRLVVAPAASLRRYHPCEQRTLARGPVLRQSGRACGPGVFLGAGICRAVGPWIGGGFVECAEFGVTGIRVPLMTMGLS